MIRGIIGLCIVFGMILIMTFKAVAQTSTKTPAPFESYQVVGEAKLTVLLWDVYRSKLLTPSGSYRPGDTPYELEITYLRDIEAADLVKQTAKEWREQGLSDDRHDSWLQQLGEIWPNVRDGDTLTLSVADNGNATFLFNKEVIGFFKDPDFASQFGGIWLSEKTTRPKLRAALIGEQQSTR